MQYRVISAVEIRLILVLIIGMHLNEHQCLVFML